MDTVKFYIGKNLRETWGLLDGHIFHNDKTWEEKDQTYFRFLFPRNLRNNFILSKIEIALGTLGIISKSGTLKTTHYFLQQKLNFYPQTLLSYEDNFNQPKIEEFEKLSKDFISLFPFYMTLETVTHPETLFATNSNDKFHRMTKSPEEMCKEYLGSF